MMVSYMTATPRKLGGISAAAVIVLVMLLSVICPIKARAADAEAPLPDARMDGYPTQVAINEGGAGGTLTFFIILTAVTAGVMFMNAKRSHLD